MLAWDVEAFLASGRRDLFFVPIALTYERLVEEGAMVGELEGEEKRDESMLGLVRARRFLRRRFGSVFVNFGEPISLADALGDRRLRFAGRATPEVEAEQRAFVEEMGTRIVERINWAVAASATAVAACALLGEQRRGLFRPELARRMRQIVDLLRLQDVRLTPELSRDVGGFSESIASLLRMDLIHSAADARGEILYFEESRRRALDLYRNGVLHFLAAPSFLARDLLRGASEPELHAELARWLELFERELFVQRGQVLAAHFPGFLDHFLREGWIAREGERFRATARGAAELRFLAEQTRPLLEAYLSVCAAAAEVGREGMGARDLTRAASEQFERAALLGEVGLAESSNPVTFGNAFDLLLHRGVLALAPPAGGGPRRDKRYVRGPAFAELPELRERLASALSGR
jgi:glycerol-3-phosphate O-acyltransferase